MKNYKNITKSEAKLTLKDYADKTNYFTGEIRYNDMVDMLRYRMQFGEAETNVIMSALILSGAKFQR